MTGQTTDDGLIVAEGPHLLDEAGRGRWVVQQILATPDARARHEGLFQASGAEILEVEARAFESVSATEATQGLLALLRPAHWSWEDMTQATALIVVLDGIQDPGNAGTIVRSAEAFGATGVVLLKGCVHVANGKLLRASAGSIFRVPFLEGVPAEACIERLRSKDIQVYALDASGATELSQAEFSKPCAIVIGSEASGVSRQLLSEAEAVRIPTTRVESLNAAMACSVALFTAQRQRTSR